MKKYNLITIVIIILLAGASCKENHSNKTQQLEQQLAELKENAYVSGLGEFMNTIQLHHEKLWFAGLNQNWPLAKYETDEMKETFKDLQKYVTNRPEVKDVPMINPGLDSMEIAISAKDLSRFKSAYVVLTNACNNCHYATDHAFIVITLPTQSPVTDQQFAPMKKK